MSITKTFRNLINSEIRISRTEYLIRIVIICFFSFISFEIFNNFESSSTSKIIYIGISFIVVLFFKIAFLIQRMNDIEISPYFFGIFPITATLGMIIENEMIINFAGIGLILGIFCLILIPGRKKSEINK